MANLKESKFKKLAESRVNKAIDTIKLVGNLSNTNNYAYTEDQARKLLLALEGQIKNTRALFMAELAKSNKTFKL